MKKESWGKKITKILGLIDELNGEYFNKTTKKEIRIRRIVVTKKEMKEREPFTGFYFSARPFPAGDYDLVLKERAKGKEKEVGK